MEYRKEGKVGSDPTWDVGKKWVCALGRITHSDWLAGSSELAASGFKVLHLYSDF